MVSSISRPEAKSNPLLKRYEVRIDSRINATATLKRIGDAFPNLEEFVIHFGGFQVNERFLGK